MCQSYANARFVWKKLHLDNLLIATYLILANVPTNMTYGTWFFTYLHLV